MLRLLRRYPELCVLWLIDAKLALSRVTTRSFGALWREHLIPDEGKAAGLFDMPSGDRVAKGLHVQESRESESFGVNIISTCRTRGRLEISLYHVY